MSLRKVLSNLYPYIKTDTNYFFVFFIGSYPQRPESNHEHPQSLKYLQNFQERKIIRVYIDSDYTKEPLANLIDRLGDNCFFHPHNINYEDYNMILEFAHIAGILNNSLSIIYEFTSIMRIEHEKITNKTPYLYISPSECLANTEDIAYNPIIENSDEGLKFYRPCMNEIGNEIEYLFQGELIEVKLNKLQFIKNIIDGYIHIIKDVYRMILNYIERKDCFDVDYEPTFIKDTAYFYPSLELLKKRMVGYNSYKTQNIIDEFLNSECNNLEIFIKERIQNLLGIILLFRNQGNRHRVNSNFEFIMFDNSKQVYEIIKKIDEVKI